MQLDMSEFTAKQMLKINKYAAAYSSRYAENLDLKRGTYTVVEGDTLSEIALRLDLHWPELARINNLENPDVIFPGQVLNLY